MAETGAGLGVAMHVAQCILDVRTVFTMTDSEPQIQQWQIDWNREVKLLIDQLDLMKKPNIDADQAFEHIKHELRMTMFKESR